MLRMQNLVNGALVVYALQRWRLAVVSGQRRVIHQRRNSASRIDFITQSRGQRRDGIDRHEPGNNQVSRKPSRTEEPQVSPVAPVGSQPKKSELYVSPTSLAKDDNRQRKPSLLDRRQGITASLLAGTGSNSDGRTAADRARAVDKLSPPSFVDTDRVKSTRPRRQSNSLSALPSSAPAAQHDITAAPPAAMSGTRNRSRSRFDFLQMSRQRSSRSESTSHDFHRLREESLQAHSDHDFSQATDASMHAGTEHNIWNPSTDSDSDNNSTDRDKDERDSGAKTPEGIIVFSD